MKPSATWVNCKATNNLPIKTLGLMQADIKIWGQMLKRNGMVVVVQDVMDTCPCNIKYECATGTIRAEIGPDYWKYVLTTGPHKWSYEGHLSNEEYKWCCLG